MADKQALTTREQVRAFNNAFERPVHESWTNMSVTDRLLVGQLLLEEVIEYIDKGLGITIVHECNGGEYSEVIDHQSLQHGNLLLRHDEGRVMDPVECVDGLADVNIVIHFNAHWHGFNLDRATTIVNDSNMSKLGADGRPIINKCVNESCAELNISHDTCDDPIHLMDPSKPIGKILKGPNFWEPTSRLSALIAEAGNNKA